MNSFVLLQLLILLMLLLLLLLADIITIFPWLQHCLGCDGFYYRNFRGVNWLVIGRRDGYKRGSRIHKYIVSVTFSITININIGFAITITIAIAIAIAITITITVTIVNIRSWARSCRTSRIGMNLR